MAASPLGTAAAAAALEECRRALTQVSARCVKPQVVLAVRTQHTE